MKGYIKIITLNNQVKFWTVYTVANLERYSIGQPVTFVSAKLP